MASAAPVVATLGGNLPDLTADVATLVPPGDPDALAAALRRAPCSPSPCSAPGLRHAGVVRVAEYTWERTPPR